MSAPDTVWLKGYPVQLGMSAVEHVEEWMREFRLMALARDEGFAEHEVPTRLQVMVRTLTARYAADLSDAELLRTAAAGRGDATVDLPYPVRPGTEQAVVAWRRMLAEVDEYCRAEDLLTLQRTPEQVRLQDWTCEEFLRQLRGEQPRPWSSLRLVTP